jgi:uncharacterized protein (UPF0335 family)
MSEGIGHNGVAPDQLKSIVERIERLHEERQAIAGDIADVYGEAKANGFDTKILRKVVALRRKDHAERKEEEAIMELYLEALGMS